MGVLRGCHYRYAPEVQIVYRSLLVAHVDVEGKQVQWRNCLATQHLEQRRKAIPIVLHLLHLLHLLVVVIIMIAHDAGSAILFSEEWAARRAGSAAKT
jgi:hypothetical protein